MTLWTREEAERWPIETKIMVDMALDAGRAVEVIDAGMFGKSPDDGLPQTFDGRLWPSDLVGVEPRIIEPNFRALNRAFRNAYGDSADKILDIFSANLKRRR